ncbi:nuclear pore complex protein Nup214-like isoform X3 [Acropora muricata]|uniref:nuclear pore complex protein Nup214-like isoform X3 n=1 Tax=Acropora muricata TaxID=159855 RepID=UPI0034E5205E
MADSDNGYPPERDVKDFSFKQMRKIRMFESPQNIPTGRSSLLDTSSKYGLIFVGCPRGIKIIKTETIEAIHEKDEGSMQNVVSHCPSSFVDLGSPVQFVCLSGNDLTLSVCYTKENATVMAFFDVPTLGSSDLSGAKFGEINLSKDAGDLDKSVDRLMLYCTETEIKTLASLPADHKASATCWSPKGKQLVVGHSDGKIVQYSPDLCGAKFGEINLSKDTAVVNVAWNPGFLGLFATCLSSGSVIVMELTETEIKTLASLPADHKASAICWSPKGKQLVVGRSDGKIVQYSQTLEAKREIECPEIFIDDPHFVTDVLWISTYLFAVAYSSFEEGDSPKFLLISTSNNGQVVITNFDDIYFAMGDDRKPAFYMKNISEWSIVVSAFSNGLEAAVVGKYGGQDPTTWEKWSFEEDARPSMPLTSNNDESFPMGLAINFNSTRPFVKGEQKLSPAPILMILSTDGVLVPFYVLNQTPNTKHDIVKPPEPLPLGGQRKSLGYGLQSGGTTLQATKGNSAPVNKISLQSGSLGTSGNIPVGTFSKENLKPSSSSPALLGSPGHASFGGLSLGGPKQTSPSATNVPSAFSKQSVQSSGLSGSASSSGFSLTGQQGGLAAFKSALQPELPATQLKKSQAVTSTLVKPTPTCQTQLNVASHLDSPVATAVGSAQSKQGSSLGRDQPVMSTVPSPKPGPGLVDKPGSKSNQLPVSKSPATAVKADSSAVTSFQSGVKASTPGAAVKTKAEVIRKAPLVPVSKSNVIEASVSQNIQEAINHFSDEMAALRDCVRKMQENCGLTDDNNDLDQLKQTTNQLGRSLAELKDTTKDQHKDIDEEKRKLLEAFEIFEDARIRQERKSDPRYVQLLKSRALDPVNANKMRDIRKLHLYLDESLREVNMILDEQWNKENERKRFIPRPALDEIYNTLKMNQMIALDQEARLEKIAEDMQKRKLLSNSWRRNLTSTDSARVPLVKGASDVCEQELRSTTQRTSPVATPISPKKRAHLRSMLQKRRSTPVRRSIIVPSAITKTPSAKLNKSQMPLLSSTPAVTASALAEETGGKFVLRSQLTEQEEATLHHGNRGVLDRNDHEVAHVTEERGPRHGASERGPSVSFVDASSPVVVATPEETESAPEIPESSDSTPASGGFSLDGTTVFEPEVTNYVNAAQSNAAVTLSAPPKPSLQVTASGAFVAVGKSAESQTALNATDTEPSKPSRGSFHPAVTEKASSCEAVSTKSEVTPCVKPISADVPPNVAAGMAAINRASAVQNGLQLPSNNSNLDPSASIEPVALVAYKPQTQKPSPKIGGNEENAAAKAIANAALMVATAEAKKPAVKPRSSTEFVFKSTESGKPGPPVVTFKPQASPTPSDTRTTVAPNVTVNPKSVINPAFGPLVPTSSVSSTSGLRLSSSGTSPAALFGPLPRSSASTGFAPQPGLFSLGPHPKPSSSAPNLSSSSIKGGDAISFGQTTVLSSTTASITPSQRVSRNIFASSEVSLPPTSIIDDLKDDSKESSLSSSSQVKASITSSSGLVAPVTTAPLSFSLSSLSSGSLVQNLVSPSNSGIALNSGVNASLPGSNVSSLATSSSEDKSAEASVASVISRSSVTGPGGLIPYPETTAPLSFSSSSLSSASFMQNQVSSSNSGIALNSGVNAGLPGSDASSFSTSPSEDKSAESNVSSSQIKASITSSSGLNAPVTTAPLSFSLSPLSSGLLMQNQISPSNSGIALNSGVNAGLPGSDVSSFSASSSEDKSAEASVPSVISTSSVTGPGGLIPSQISFSTPTLSGGSFFKNLASTGNSNTGSSTGAIIGTVGSSTSVLNSLLRSSETSSAGIASSSTAFAPTSVAALSSATPTETLDASATTAFTSPSVGVGGFFTPALLEGNKPVFVPAESAAPTLTRASSIFGSVSTTVPSTTGVLFGSPSISSIGAVSTPLTTSVESRFLAVSAASPASPSSSVTTTASALFSSMINAFTKESASIKSPPVTVMSSSQSTTTTLPSAGGSYTSEPSRVFSSPISAFGAVSTADGSLGFGSLAKAATSSSSGSLFGASPSTAFAPTSGFGSFTTTAGSQGNTFGSAPVFGSPSASPAPSMSFGAKPSFGQSSFITTSSSGFSQTASKPSENTLGFGFTGFGLGGPGTSQTNNENPFIVAQGFAVPATTRESSLFGGKSGEDVFKSSLSTGPFSQSAFGSPPSGGFSGGTFSSQNRSVLSSGFGVGASSIPAGNSGFGVSNPFGSPSASASAFGGAPSFGSTPAFGGVPAFGGSPQGGLSATPSTGVFGSGGSGMFGQSSGSPSFGALASQTGVPSFGALAGQSSSQVGFGGLQPQQQQSTPSFGSFGGSSQSPSGSSFSQWR